MTGHLQRQPEREALGSTGDGGARVGAENCWVTTVGYGDVAPVTSLRMTVLDRYCRKSRNPRMTDFSACGQPFENPHWICQFAVSAGPTSRERELSLPLGQILLPSLYGPVIFRASPEKDFSDSIGHLYAFGPNPPRRGALRFALHGSCGSAPPVMRGPQHERLFIVVRNAR